MIAEHFEEWFANKLLPNVQPNSLIVMDNAPVVILLPVKSWTKKMMQEWLWAKGIVFPQKVLKS